MLRSPCPFSASSWPGVAVRRTASLPLAYVPPVTDARLEAGQDDITSVSGGLSQNLLTRGLEWRDQVAGLHFLREQDDLFARLFELIQVVVDDALELGLQRCGFLALAIRRERDRTDNGRNLVAVQILGNRLLVERAGRLDRGFDQLARGVAEGCEIKAERIDLGRDGALRILVEKGLGALEIHRGLGQPGVEVDDAIEQRAHLLHHRTELQADHPAAE